MMYLAKVHGLHTFATQCRTNGRRGRCLAGTDDEFDDLIVCESFARHFVWLVYELQSIFTCDSIRSSHATTS
jgi:hypothetical protein